MDKTTRTQAAQSTLLLLFWMGWTVLIITGRIEVAAPYSRLMFMSYAGVSIVLGIIFGRQWDFKLEEVANAAPAVSVDMGRDNDDYHNEGQLEDATEDYPDDD
ncbi:hypothetical protein [Saliphagus sp. LR7]|uniref:hypothetical protein n=1 Tax=Saliphagus sp. LR7 TaxID=2282654 RepID=UPI000DF814CA|nr:hypothetical protein [Saliphagus sp. LR7]